jgi:spore germination protein
MEIYIVQIGDTIYSIAEKFGLDADRLIYDNNLSGPDQLVPGQALVIAFPKQSHVVQQGDTLQSIADYYNISPMQILRNNPFLFDREYLYPGELLVISYHTDGKITTNGYTFPFINRNALKKTLPNLTYLSIFNYRLLENFDIYTYEDDTELIGLSKEYQTIPLLLVSVLTLQGEPDINTAYRILLDEEGQSIIIDKFVDIMKSRGYRGANIVINLLNQSNQSLIQNYIKKIYERLHQENLLLILTINFTDDLLNENIDYSQFNSYVDAMAFIQLKWGKREGPPGPVSNIQTTEKLINQVLTYIPPEKLSIGESIIGYDWQLPYIPYVTSIVALRMDAVYDIALEHNSVIQFDENTQTPYFMYIKGGVNLPSIHIVWFVDARSIQAQLKFIKRSGISGSSVWNIMFFNPKLWIIFNSQFEIVKIR